MTIWPQLDTTLRMSGVSRRKCASLAERSRDDPTYATAKTEAVMPIMLWLVLPMSIWSAFFSQTDASRSDY
jgi:hypothetical protein